MSESIEEKRVVGVTRRIVAKANEKIRGREFR
jgi:hypothetical protein